MNIHRAPFRADRKYYFGLGERVAERATFMSHAQIRRYIFASPCWTGSSTVIPSLRENICPPLWMTSETFQLNRSFKRPDRSDGRSTASVHAIDTSIYSPSAEIAECISRFFLLLCGRRTRRARRRFGRRLCLPRLLFQTRVDELADARREHPHRGLLLLLLLQRHLLLAGLGLLFLSKSGQLK